MSASFEAVIRDILLTQRDPDRVVQSFIKRLKSESPSRAERKAFVAYLINAGHFSEVLELYINWFKEENRIPMAELLHTLHASGFQPQKEFLDRVFEAQSHLDPADRLTHFTPWEPLDARLAQLHEELMQKSKKAAEAFKDGLLNQLEYYQTNRMLDEEERHLNRLSEIYPKDEYIQEQKHNFKERWARAILAKRSIETFDSQIETTVPLFTKDELSTADVLAEEMKDLVSKKPQLAYDFAIALFTMELYELARTILSYAPVTAKVEWLYIEILLQAKRYLECLDALATIDQKYGDNPETTFATTYYRALALEGIGDRGTALELLRSLVQIRPSYRSAHALLLKWGGAP